MKVLVVLGHFWPRLPTAKVFVFSWSFLAKVINGESFVFSSFLAKDTNGESFGWPWSFLAKVTNSESFCFFLVIFSQGYQR